MHITLAKQILSKITPGKASLHFHFYEELHGKLIPLFNTVYRSKLDDQYYSEDTMRDGPPGMFDKYMEFEGGCVEWQLEEWE